MNQTVGDAIVAVGGLARPTPEAVKSCVSASLMLRDIANAFEPSCTKLTVFSLDIPSDHTHSLEHGKMLLLYTKGADSL